VDILSGVLKLHEFHNRALFRLLSLSATISQRFARRFCLFCLFLLSTPQCQSDIVAAAALQRRAITAIVRIARVIAPRSHLALQDATGDKPGIVVCEINEIPFSH
jgi:hypothetical protein